MPLVTNRCPKHKNAFPEAECPLCKQELWEDQVEASRKFFETHRNYHLRASFFEVKGNITIEDLYQHFRARLLEELNPTLMKMDRE